MGSQFDPDMLTKPYQLTPTIRRSPYATISPENPRNSQKGQIIVITGAGTGIGAAAAAVWARAGASGIVIAGRRICKLEEVSRDLGEKYPAVKTVAIRTDVTVPHDVESLFARTTEEFGRCPDVILANAGVLEKSKRIAEQDVDEWWNSMTVNVKGLFLTVQNYIKSQPDSNNPTGTIISVSSGLVGRVAPGASGYSIGKLREQKLGEYVDAEYPNLRMFTTFPGLCMTSMIQEFAKPYALDHLDLTGCLALYLSQPRADYLRGGIVCVNWDVDEMEAEQKKLVSSKMLKTSWLPALPLEGGKGLVV